MDFLSNDSVSLLIFASNSIGLPSSGILNFAFLKGELDTTPAAFKLRTLGCMSGPPSPPRILRVFLLCRADPLLVCLAFRILPIYPSGITHSIIGYEQISNPAKLVHSLSSGVEQTPVT